MDERRAIALRYDDSLPAPFVLASGRNQLADRLVDMAVRYGVPLERGDDLVDRLIVLEPGMVIPEELYQPIAQIFAFLAQIEKDGERTND